MKKKVRRWNGIFLLNPERKQFLVFYALCCANISRPKLCEISFCVFFVASFETFETCVFNFYKVYCVCVYIRRIVNIEHVKRITKGSLDLHMLGKEMKTTFGYMEKRGGNNKNHHMETSIIITWRWGLR